MSPCRHPPQLFLRMSHVLSTGQRYGVLTNHVLDTDIRRIELHRRSDISSTMLMMITTLNYNCHNHYEDQNARQQHVRRCEQVNELQ